MKLKLAIAGCALLFALQSKAQLGVGTTSPVSTLDVRGSVSFNNRTITANASLSTTDHTVVFTGTSNVTVTLPSASACTGREIYIKNFSTNNSDITIATTSSQTVDGNSSWTIRNRNEAVLLMSDGSNWIVKQQSIPNNTGGAAWYPTGNEGTTAGTNFIGTTDAIDFVTKTNNTEVMRASSAGNVGIGTTSPGSKLDVKGTLRLSGATSGYVGFAAAAAAGSTTYTLPSADGTSGQQLTTNGSGVLSWAAAGSGGSTTHTMSSSTNTITSIVNGVSATASAVNSVSNTSSTNTLTTTVNGVAATGVNIINSNATSLSGTSLTTTVNGVASTALNLAGLDSSIYKTDGTLRSSRSVTLSDKNLTFSSTTGNMIFNPSSTGKVGIGTTSPGSTLDVKGTLRLSGSTSGYVGFVPAAAAGSTTYTLPNADGTSGQVLSTNGSGTLSWATASGGSGWGLTGNTGTTAGTNFIGTTDSKDFVLKTNNTERLRVDAAGEVGIGTSSPTQKFHIVGGDNTTSVGSATTNILSLVENNQNGSAVEGLKATYGGNTYISTIGINPAYPINGQVGDIAFYGSYNGTNTNYMAYDFVNKNVILIPNVTGPANFVGVGTTTPKSVFEVNGGIANNISTQSGSSAVTLDNTASIWYFTSSASITLPTASTCTNRIYQIINSTASSKTISSYTALSTGSASTSIAARGSIEIISNGTSWLQIR